MANKRDQYIALFKQLGFDVDQTMSLLNDVIDIPIDAVEARIAVVRAFADDPALLRQKTQEFILSFGKGKGNAKVKATSAIYDARDNEVPAYDGGLRFEGTPVMVVPMAQYDKKSRERLGKSKAVRVEADFGDIPIRIDKFGRKTTISFLTVDGDGVDQTVRIADAIKRLSALTALVLDNPTGKVAPTPAKGKGKPQAAH